MDLICRKWSKQCTFGVLELHTGACLVFVHRYYRLRKRYVVYNIYGLSRLSLTLYEIIIINHAHSKFILWESRGCRRTSHNYGHNHIMTSDTRHCHFFLWDTDVVTNHSLVWMPLGSLLHFYSNILTMSCHVLLVFSLDIILLSACTRSHHVHSHWSNV